MALLDRLNEQLKNTTNPAGRTLLINRINEVKEQQRTNPPAPTYQINKTGNGFSGTLSPEQMKTFQGLDPTAQNSYIAGLYNQQTPPPVAPNAPKTTQGPPMPQQKQTPPPVPPTGPALGYGGYTYGTDPTKDRAAVEDRNRLATDPAYKQSEITRTNAVIAARKAQGLDTTEQENYLNTLNANPDTSASVGAPNQGPPMPGNGSFVGAPAPPTQPVPQQPSYINAPMTEDQIQKQAEDAVNRKLQAALQSAIQSKQAASTAAGQQTSAIQTQLEQALQRLQTGATQAQQGLQTNFERANQLEQQNRTLQDVAFARNNNPFSGRTDYAKGLIGREREITDRQQEQDLANQIANLNQNLANQTGELTENAQAQFTKIQQDLANTRTAIDQKYEALKTAAPGDIDALVQQIRNDERQYALNLKNYELNLAKFNYDISPENPANQAQTIQNKISQLKLDQLPETLKAQAQLLQQQVQGGKISNEQAQYQLDQLTDPNSVTNQIAKLDLQLKQMDAKNAPEQYRLQLEQLRKTVNQIGKQPIQSDIEKEMAETNLKIAQEKLKQLQNGTGQQGNSALNANDYINAVKDNFTKPTGQYDNAGKPITQFDSDAARKYILGLNIPDEQVAELLQYFNLPLQTP